MLGIAHGRGSVGMVPQKPPDDELIQAFKDWYRDLLRRHGLSQEEAARVLSTTVRISSGTSENWARGMQTPSYRALVAIAQVFGELPPDLVAPLRDESDETEAE